LIFFDKKTKRSKDENGFLTIKDNPIITAGVFEYVESELFEGGSSTKIVKVYRDFEHLKKIKDTFSNKPIMYTHKWVGDKANQVDGVIATEIRIDEKNKAIISDLIIYNPDLIKIIENGIDELSPAYTGKVTPSKGRYNGVDYDYVQTVNIGNHLAVVPYGRAGVKLRVQDEKTNINKGDIDMNPKDLIAALTAFFAGEVKMEDKGAKVAKVKAIMDADCGDDEKEMKLKELFAEKIQDKEVMPTDKKEKSEDIIEKKEVKEVEKKVQDSKQEFDMNAFAGAIAQSLEGIVSTKLDERLGKFENSINEKNKVAKDIETVLGTNFKGDGMNVDQMYQFGYEKITGNKIQDGLDSKTAFLIASQPLRKTVKVQDSKQEPVKNEQMVRINAILAKQ
jgi:hypothetical protein